MSLEVLEINFFFFEIGSGNKLDILRLTYIVEASPQLEYFAVHVSTITIL